MRIRLTISTEDGLSYEGELQLKPVTAKRARKTTGRRPAASPSSRKAFDFSLPLRAFVTAHHARRLSGPQKFTLILAGITKGDTTVAPEIKDGSILQSMGLTNCDPLGRTQYLLDHPCLRSMKFSRRSFKLVMSTPWFFISRHQ